jgi:hypothetical protein
MNMSRILMTGLLGLALASGANARTVAAEDYSRFGIAPRPQLAAGPGDAAASPDAFYVGDLVHPLVIHLPDDASLTRLATPRQLPGVTSNAHLFERAGLDDEADVLAYADPWQLDHGKFTAYHHGPGRVHLDDPRGSPGGSGGSVTSVPLPPALPLLGSVLAALLLAGGIARRS